MATQTKHALIAFTAPVPDARLVIQRKSPQALHASILMRRWDNLQSWELPKWNVSTLDNRKTGTHEKQDWPLLGTYRGGRRRKVMCA